MTLATLVIVFFLYFGTGMALFRLIKLFGFRANDPDSEISFAVAVLFIWPVILAALILLCCFWAIGTAVTVPIKCFFRSRLFKKAMGIS
jgi:hypothetical protein